MAEKHHALADIRKGVFYAIAYSTEIAPMRISMFCVTSGMIT